MKNLDIKDIWKGGNAEDKKVFEKPEIDKMIRKGSDSLIHRFIKTLTFELWINFLVFTSLSVGLFFSHQWLVGGVMTLLNLVFFLYYKRLIKKLKVEKIDSTVLEYLYTIRDMVNRFILHYKIATIALSVLIIGLVFYLEGGEFYSKYTANPKSFLIGLTGGILVAIPFSLYMIHLMYGKKAKKLAHMICSLEEEEA